MGKHIEPLSVRVLLLQMLSYALLFAAQNAGNFAERVLLAPDTTATAALGLSWTAFCLLYAFTINVVNVCQFAVGRCTGKGDDRGARAAAALALLLAAARNVDPSDRAGFTQLYFRVWQLFFLEYAIVPICCLAG
jgi:hypothetical protein